MRITLTIPGEPIAQPRPRATAKPVGGGKWIGVVYNPKDAEPYKARIAEVATPLRPPILHTGPVRVDILWVFPRPQYLLTKSAPRERLPYTPKPDRDNLDKAVLDAFVECGYWRDDAQVYDGRITKWWAAIGEEPHTEIVITLQPSTGAIEPPTPTP